ncbi:MAG TPA: PQQ-binding-like beta-propeller repeat protein, partial [Phycisphaerae bacterium]|nr:PQQ-binding-like beta-propeller repeat protein [Phycisphaerae bacterium]
SKAGETKWTINILKEFGAKNIRWGMSESPLIDEVRLIVMPGGKDATIVALNRFDGTVIWKSKGLSDEASYASGILADVGGVKQAIYLTGQAAVGVKADDGTLLWRNTRPANNVANCTTPIYRDGLAFICSQYDTGGILLRLTSKGGKTNAEEVYFTRDMMNHHGGVVLVGDCLYGCSNNTLTCMDFKTGKVRWKDRSVGKCSVTAADGMLYCLSETGVLGLVEATPEKYKEASRFSFKVKGGHSWAHPVVAGGFLYVRNGDEISCYDVRAK